ncbi:MAG TPA: type II toxin-antitoxin system prevent-host-death family antitoxin [Pirellulales bacterium]|nr:type II toxin-antitoxin system prevent-host-death family antitoxin [Pirellulales bacterium]
MVSIGSYEAKTHLPKLLERVEQGERILITRRGKAVAMLVPCVAHSAPDKRAVIDKFKAYSRQQGRTLGDLTIREMIDEGRQH